MFFSKQKQEDAARELLNEKMAHRLKIKLAEITELNEKIIESVTNTQTEGQNLLNKLKYHLKNGSRTFNSLSQKLTSGVLILNYRGEILQSNPKAHQILNCPHEGCHGIHIFDMITSIIPVNPGGQKIVLSPTFFENLSACIYQSMNSCTAMNKDEGITHGYLMCLSKIHCPLPTEQEQLVHIESTKLIDGTFMKITFSILDNEPEVMEDLAYVIILRQSKNRNERRSFISFQDGQIERRLGERRSSAVT